MTAVSSTLLLGEPTKLAEALTLALLGTRIAIKEPCERATIDVSTIMMTENTVKVHKQIYHMSRTYNVRDHVYVKLHGLRVQRRRLV